MKQLKLSIVFLVLTLISCSGGSSSSSSDPLMANFLFTYTIISTWDNRVTMDEKTSDTTSEGNPMYSGYDADSPSYAAAGAWYDSLGAYLLVMQTSVSDLYWTFQFTIADDGALSGVYRMMISSTLYTAYALHSPSYRYEEGKWSSFTSYGRSGDAMLRMSEMQGDAPVYDPALLAATQDLALQLN